MDLYRRGLRDGLPIGLGYISVSFSFGIKAVSGGLTILQSLLISATNLTSAGQVAGLDGILALAPLLEVLLVQLTINMRYALMSISLSQKLGEDMTVGRRLFAGFFITDEVFAVASARRAPIGHAYLYGLFTAPYIGWALGTFLGAAAGTLLPARLCAALGIAIYGMFIAIIVPPARHDVRVRFVVLIACAAALIFRYLPIFSAISSGVAVILCAAIAAGAGALLYPVKEDA